MQLSHICFAIAGIIIAALYYRRMLQKHRNQASNVATGIPDLRRREMYLKQDVIFIFKEIQSAWLDGDLEKLSSYLERDLYTLWLAARAQVSAEKWAEATLQAQLEAAEIFGGKDFLENTKDEFLVKFYFKMGASSSGNEIWKMGRFQNRWKVRSITGDPQTNSLSVAL